MRTVVDSDGSDGGSAHKAVTDLPALNLNLGLAPGQTISIKLKGALAGISADRSPRPAATGAETEAGAGSAAVASSRRGAPLSAFKLEPPPADSNLPDDGASPGKSPRAAPAGASHHDQRSGGVSSHTVSSSGSSDSIANTALHGGPISGTSVADVPQSLTPRAHGQTSSSTSADDGPSPPGGPAASSTGPAGTLDSALHQSAPVASSATAAATTDDDPDEEWTDFVAPKEED